jgi:hypothetical protein
MQFPQQNSENSDYQMKQLNKGEKFPLYLLQDHAPP